MTLWRASCGTSFGAVRPLPHLCSARPSIPGYGYGKRATPLSTSHASWGCMRFALRGTPIGRCFHTSTATDGKIGSRGWTNDDEPNRLKREFAHAAWEKAHALSKKSQ